MILYIMRLGAVGNDAETCLETIEIKMNVSHFPEPDFFCEGMRLIGGEGLQLMDEEGAQN